MKKIQLVYVEHLPKELAPGILYVSKEFAVGGHLCPCGCGSKIITPFGPTEWSFTDKEGLASLDPSLGNWQLSCRSHYWIVESVIHWSYPWSDEQIKLGWQSEEAARRAYFEGKKQPYLFLSWWRRLRSWFSGEKV